MNAKKIVAALLAAVLLIGVGVGGTLAWLMDSTETITNTFSTSDIEVVLQESTGTEYQMIPGHTIAKNPKAWVETGSIPAYLFVKVEKSSNFDTYMEAEINPAWTELTSPAGATYKVYYKTVVGNDDMGESAAISILEDDVVKVKDAVTKEMMNVFDADKNGTLSDTEKQALPKLTFTAYAHQLYKNDSSTTPVTFTAAEAWANLTTPATP